MIFQEKCFKCYILLINSILLHCLIAFTSWDIGHYMYYNCFLTRFSRCKFCIKPYISNQAVFLDHQKGKTKIWISLERKKLLRWNQNSFIPDSAPLIDSLACTENRNELLLFCNDANTSIWINTFNTTVLFPTFEVDAHLKHFFRRKSFHNVNKYKTEKGRELGCFIERKCFRLATFLIVNDYFSKKHWTYKICWSNFLLRNT